MTLGGWQTRDPEGLHGVNVCVGCEQAFSCLSAFDAHGDGDGNCLPPKSVGLEFWRPLKPPGAAPVWRWPAAKYKRNDDNFYARDKAEVRH